MSILDYQNIVTTVSISPALIEQLQLLIHTKNHSKTIRFGIAYYFLISPKDLYINDDFCLRQLLSAEERHTKKNYSIRFEENFTCHFPNPKEENNETQEKQEKKHNISNIINHILAATLYLLKNMKKIKLLIKLLMKLLIKLLTNHLFIF